MASYVLGELDYTELSLTARMSYTFTPTLSFQLYVQPFSSTGAYRDYKVVQDPLARERSRRYHVLEPDETRIADGVVRVDRNGDGQGEFSFALADFDFQELQLNMVVRWEYRPSSTLFLVWSHNRAGAGLSSRGDERGEHVVLAKLTYWYGL